MPKWENFSIWRGRLPHWRADNVVYYCTFRHRRPLESWERDLLFRSCLKPDGKDLDLIILCVLPEQTEMMFRDQSSKDLTDVVDRAKTKAGKLIIKKTGERFPPFFNESYDRIIRDDGEFEEFWMRILESPVDLELVEEPGEYETLWVPNSPEIA